MIKRRLEEKIKDSLLSSRSVSLMGPRQVGKTTIALNIAESNPAIYLDRKIVLSWKKFATLLPFTIVTVIN